MSKDQNSERPVPTKRKSSLRLFFENYWRGMLGGGVGGALFGPIGAGLGGGLGVAKSMKWSFHVDWSRTDATKYVIWPWLGLSLSFALAMRSLRAVAPTTAHDIGADIQRLLAPVEPLFPYIAVIRTGAANNPGNEEIMASFLVGGVLALLAVIHIVILIPKLLTNAKATLLLIENE